MTRLHHQEFARQLRTNQTDAERKLWGAIRKRSFCEFRFQRQVSIGPFVVDFLCREKGLVIEVDGFGHNDAADIRSDASRDAFLRSRGFQVHRVNNADVYANLGGVLDGLLLRLEALPSRYQRKG